MGLILDTSVLIDAERKQQDVEEMLERLPLAPEEAAAISSIALMEFANGLARAVTESQRVRRQRFLENVLAILEVVPFGIDLAVRTGQLNGEMQQRGVVVSPLDLMIGVTALEMGYAVATRNVKHFRMIPGLQVTEV